MGVPALPRGLDPLIAEAKERARRRWILLGLLALVVVAAAVVALTQLPSRARVSPLPARHGSPLYSVATIVASYGTHALACHASALMTDEPGGGCSGVPLAGGDLERFAVRHYSSGGWDTSILRLVGTWDGHVFHVTSATPATHGSGESDPNCLAHRTGPVVRVSNQELTQASPGHGIMVSGPCGHTYWFLVPVADHRAVSSLRHLFGKSVLVTGWLRPVARK